MMSFLLKIDYNPAKHPSTTLLVKAGILGQFSYIKPLDAKNNWPYFSQTAPLFSNCNIFSLFNI